MITANNSNLITDDFGNTVLAVHYGIFAEFATHLTHAYSDSESDWLNRYHGYWGFSEMSNDQLNDEVSDWFAHSGDAIGHPELIDSRASDFVCDQFIALMQSKDREPVELCAYGGLSDKNRLRLIAARAAYEKVLRAPL